MRTLIVGMVVGAVLAVGASSWAEHLESARRMYLVHGVSSYPRTTTSLAVARGWVAEVVESATERPGVGGDWRHGDTAAIYERTCAAKLVESTRIPTSPAP